MVDLVPCVAGSPVGIAFRAPAAHTRDGIGQLPVALLALNAR